MAPIDTPNLRGADGAIRRFTNIPEQEAHLTRLYKDKTVWSLWYVMAATRSEGMHGVITDKKGQQVIGVKKGQEMKIDNNIYVWHGEWVKRKNLFDHSGWLPKEIGLYTFKKLEQRTKSKRMKSKEENE